MKRQRWILAGMIVLYAAMTCINLYQWLRPLSQYPVAARGVLDAREWDFASQGIIPLQGEWEFYEGVLLEPRDFRKQDTAAAPRYLQVPEGWKNVIHTEAGNGFGAGTYRLIVEVAEDNLYGIRAKKIRMSNRVFMNGVEVGGSGRPAVTEEPFISSNLPVLGAAGAEGGPVEIIIQVASFNYLEGGLVQTPEFGFMGDVLKRRDHDRLADTILVTILLTFSLYFGAMFRQWDKEPYLKFFSFFCLAAGLFYSIDNEIIAAGIVPSLTFPFLQKLLFFLPIATFLFFTHYVYSYLEMRDNLIFRWLRRIMYAAMALIWVLPNYWFVRLLNPGGVLLYAVTFAVILHAIFMSRSKGRMATYYMLIGVFFLTTSWLFAHLRYQFALDNPYYMIATPLLLVFSQAFLMSDRIREAHRKSEALAGQLIAYDKQKDEFLAKTSHELRTPLHGIVNLSQSLLDDKLSPLPAEHRENIYLLHLMGRRLVGLVHDILDMNRIRHGQLNLHRKPVDLRSTVRFVMETLSLSAAKKEVRLADALPDGLPLVLADEDRLRQILHNLIENGLKFTPLGMVTVSAEQHDNRLRVVIADTGPGIPEDQLPRLLRPFEQLDASSGIQGGLGLGLTIAKELAELHGTELEVRSKPGEGSQFAFMLPIAPGFAESAAAAEAPPESTDYFERSEERVQGTQHILIVDDEPANLKVLIDAVRAAGYSYTAVGSGEEALSSLLSERKPDLVMLDLMMPGVSGLEVCREVRSRLGLAELPVLMLTASGQAKDVLASFEAGANDIVQKPFELAELNARMQSLLAMKSSSDHAVRRELDFLQAQIMPHFLYNSLNALMGLSYKDGDKLRETIHNLTTYLRHKFTFVFEGEQVQLEKELELVRAYLAIEQLRFGSRLEVVYHIDAAAASCKLPPLTLQPIVENAVRHGIGPKPDGGRVTIRINRSVNEVIIRVEDDGVGMSETALKTLDGEQGRGVGFHNVNRRLQALYGRRLHVSSRAGEGTAVIIQLPEGSEP
ncbi:response regulator [Paenibacillus nanensis]|uniref:histidine kinase n=1 Tax=Paenibacillus nanensis TaxID=393251 RepID=A0A3A1UU66_9BACL|nr:ATP-binding protein [Paenibacillus nanensis]RIX52079.1 response regulator [Paenibacillus nanensis]